MNNLYDESLNKEFFDIEPPKTLGNHIFLDIANFYGDQENLGNMVFNIMLKCVKKTPLTIVHEKLCILGEGKSPPGFCAVILVDESHVTAHSYSDLGILCIDCFSCGPTNVLELTKDILNELTKVKPKLICTYLQRHKRFHYFPDN